MARLNPFESRAGEEKLLGHGNELLDGFLNPSAFGAHSALIFGPIGSGKTSLMLALAELFRKRGWYVIVRGREILEVSRLPKWRERTEIIIPEGYKLSVRVQGVGKKKYPKIGVKEYKSLAELVKLLHRKKLSVVYPDPGLEIPEWLKSYEGVDVIPKEAIFWYEIFKEVIRKLGGKKTAIFIDESHELWSSGSFGAYWHLIEKTKNKIADFRKARVTLVATTHASSDIDWRIISKTDYRFYLPGSRPLRGSLIKPKFTILLTKGRAFIEYSKFGVVKFRLLPDNGEIWLAALRKAKRG